MQHYFKHFGVDENDVVVDMGACIGQFTLAIDKFKKCYCIEASPLHTKDLRHNVKSLDNCEVVPYAIGAKTETKEWEFDIGPNRIETVNIITFKKFITDYNIDKIDYLKVDIERGEFDLFSNAENFDWIVNHVDKITCELHLMWNVNEKYLPYKEQMISFTNKLKQYYDITIESINGIDVTQLFWEQGTQFYHQLILFAKRKVQNTGKFLAGCSFYNNTDDHIKRAFDNVINQTHNNWLFIVGDDFSTDDTKQRLAEEVKRRNHPNILLYDVKFKRELYLYQQLFSHINYDYFIDLDADDKISPKMFEIYNKHFQENPDAFSIFSDHIVVDESGKRERISAIRPSNNYFKEFDNRNSLSYAEIWNQYSSWSMFGTGRCFRKMDMNKFPLAHNGRTATDSFVFFNSLNYGKHLHVPRNLYTWIHRPNSDSSTSLTTEEHQHYNLNTYNVMNRTKNISPVELYKDIYLETTALSYAPFINDVDTLNLISDISKEKFDLLSDLYFDKKIAKSEITNNIIVVWNRLTLSGKKNIVENIIKRNAKYSIYVYFEKGDFDKQRQEIMEELNKYGLQNYNYFHYFRHLIIHN